MRIPKAHLYFFPNPVSARLRLLLFSAFRARVEFLSLAQYQFVDGIDYAIAEILTRLGGLGGVW
ncbi:MAG: hypothetical protein ACYCQM_01445 [Acidithiobacillus sp.]